MGLLAVLILLLLLFNIYSAMTYYFKLLYNKTHRNEFPSRYVDCGLLGCDAT
jgi:hypothetical protein